MDVEEVAGVAERIVIKSDTTISGTGGSSSVATNSAPNAVAIKGHHSPDGMITTKKHVGGHSREGVSSQMGLRSFSVY